MNPLCWSSCLWLWFMFTGVECLPKFHLSSRYEDDDSVTLTINYIVDKTHITDQKVQIEGFLQWVTHQTMVEFQNFFQFEFTLYLRQTITYLENETDLKQLLKQNEIGTSIWPEGALSTLSGYYKGQSNFDIICLVTKLTLDDGYMVRNGYGYHGGQTLCKESLPILLAYASDHQAYSSYMLLSIIIDSISPGVGEPVYNVPSDQLDKVKNHLRKCKNPTP
uniref:Putative p32 protein n=1 Tax=Ixodes ricinus TaxID=34613 RepID=A0A0K8R9P6_IXORI